MLRYYEKYVRATGWTKDLSLLLIRLLLAYVFLYPAMGKWSDMESTIAWFGNDEWGLGLPFPALNAYLAATTEIVGVALLTLGLFTRVISAPLIFVMMVAIKTVHWANGWFTIGQSTINEEVAERLKMARSILREHGNYDWLTDQGGFAVLQNGWENPVTYIVMLLILISFGAGRISLDHFLLDKKRKNHSI